jgi:hypothetical protein
MQVFIKEIYITMRKSSQNNHDMIIDVEWNDDSFLQTIYRTLVDKEGKFTGDDQKFVFPGFRMAITPDNFVVVSNGKSIVKVSMDGRLNKC